MKRLMAMVAAALLAACGADGDPERPETARADGVQITGEAWIGTYWTDG